jgi:hypothetical protein
VVGLGEVVVVTVVVGLFEVVADGVVAEEQDATNKQTTTITTAKMQANHLFLYICFSFFLFFPDMYL